MRWSVEELFRAWQYQYSFHFKWWKKVFFGWGSFYRCIKATIHWLFKGYTQEELWNLDKYFLDVIILKLKHFQKIEKCGHPNDFASIKDWEKMVDDIINSFEKMKYCYYEDMIPNLELYTEKNEFNFTVVKFKRQKNHEKIRDLAYRAQYENNEKALFLFTKYFNHFWD